MDDKVTDKPEVMALRILDWDARFEVNNFKREFTFGSNQEKRKLPLPYVRRPSLDMGRSEEWQEFLTVAGPWHAERCEGFYYALAAMAAKKQRENRGWIVNRRREPMGIPEIAAARGTPVELVAYDLELLVKMKLIAWENCEFAVACGQPVKMSLSAEDVMNCESLQTKAKFANCYITEPELKQNLNTDIRAGSSYGAKKEEKEPAAPGPLVPDERFLRGLPAPAPESSESDSENSEKTNPETLNSEILTRGGGGQGAKGTDNITHWEGEKERIKTGMPAYLPLNFKEVLGQLQSMKRIHLENPVIMTEDLAEKSPELRRAHLVSRTWMWLEMLFPDQLDPGDTATEEAQKEAKWSYNTFKEKLLKLWEAGGEYEMVEFIRNAQKKHAEAVRPRSRIRDPVRVVVNELNKQIVSAAKRSRDPPAGEDTR